MKPFRAPDGSWWGVQVQMPTHSNAMVVFHHPTGETARLNRYAWVNARTASATDLRGRLTSSVILGALTDRELARLYQRSMPIETSRPVYIAS